MGNLGAEAASLSVHGLWTRGTRGGQGHNRNRATSSTATPVQKTPEQRRLEFSDMTPAQMLLAWLLLNHPLVGTRRNSTATPWLQDTATLV
ncbi:hypothetical protein E2562_038452 [Oryza meyeriana var. granulata]|uniref:Uncharacterized protein n=1 Tax=Oryza meyeriana var. granulata TaxID=110450 RepID=A0A6G1C136_9ORYZ|nr:hypothetical protein E2562_038452 [Oryza meyeriana var. granulata]